MSEASELLQQRLNEVNNYQQTVKALLAFAAFVVHDGKEQRPGAEFGFGRRMTTSEKNKVRPSADVTPDLVAQKSNEYGITAEVKKTLPQDQGRWLRYVEQLLKYDDELTGWWTPEEAIPCADTVLLLHHSRSRSFCNLLEKTQADQPGSVGANTSVVEFGSSDETASYYFFRLEHGTIRDKELAGRLVDAIQVPLDDLVMSFPNVKYYDTPPPIPYLLKELWMEVFPAMLTDTEHEYDEKHKATRFPASAKEITAELQKANGSETLSKDQRSVEFPTYRRIKEALDKLVELKMALPPAEGNDVYQILFKQIQGNVLKRFIELDLRRQATDKPGGEDKPSQMSLFQDDEEPE